jgi:hypothetical protein
VTKSGLGKNHMQKEFAFANNRWSEQAFPSHSLPLPLSRKSESYAQNVIVV